MTASAPQLHLLKRQNITLKWHCDFGCHYEQSVCGFNIPADGDNSAFDKGFFFLSIAAFSLGDWQPCSVELVLCRNGT